jgi:uncharacterized lipoprotein
LESDCFSEGKTVRQVKTKKLMVLTLLAILLLSTMACGWGGEQATPMPGYLTYSDETNGFSISYPEDWNTMPQESLDAALIGFQDPEC